MSDVLQSDEAQDVAPQTNLCRGSNDGGFASQSSSPKTFIQVRDKCSVVSP